MGKSARLSAAAAALVALLAVAAFAWPTRYRYERFNPGGYSTVARIDRLSGEAEMLTDGGWVPMRPDAAAPASGPPARATPAAAPPPTTEGPVDRLRALQERDAARARDSALDAP